MVFLSKLWKTAAILLAASVLGVLSPPLMHEAAAGDSPQKAQGAKSNVDRLGDPLPPGAIGRLGTLRFRTPGIMTPWVGFLTDSKTVITATEGAHPLQFWEASTGKLLREMSLGDVSVRQFVLSPDCKYVALAQFTSAKGDPSARDTISIWDISLGKEIQKLKRPEKTASYVTMTFTPDSKLLASLDRSGILRIEEVATGIELLQQKVPSDIGPSLAFSPDGKMLGISTGPNSRKLFLWNWQAGEEPRQLPVPERAGDSLVFSPDSKILVECGDNAGLHLWDVASGRLMRRLQVSEKGFHFEHAVFTPDGKTLVASTSHGMADNSIHLWDAQTWQYKSRLDSVFAKMLRVSPDGKLLVGSNYGGLRVWELASGKAIASNDEAHRELVKTIAVNGDLIATCSNDETIRLWDAKTGRQLRKWPYIHWGSGVALSPDGTKMLAAMVDDSSRQEYVCLWETATGRLIYKLAGHGDLGRCLGVSFTSDGKSFLSWGYDFYLRKRDVATGRALLEHAIRPQGLKISEEPILNERLLLTAIGESIFSPNGKTLILNAQNRLHVFDVDSGKELESLPHDAGRIYSLAFSPDSRMLLLSASGKRVKTTLPDGKTKFVEDENHLLCLYELASRSIRKKILLPAGGAGPVAFSSDGKFFAIGTGAPDRRVRVYDTAKAEEIGTIQGFDGLVRGLAFSADGRGLITGMSDTTVLLWDLKLKR